MNKLIRVLYPPRCQLCGSSHHLQYDGQLCTFCAADIRVNDNACHVCALPLVGRESRETGRFAVCGHCVKYPPVYDVCWSPFVYAQPLEWMIHQLKFGAKLHFSSLLSSLMAEKLPDYLYQGACPEVIIPMPLHYKRLKQRGFNQSYLLIKPVARALSIPIDLSFCERVRDTEHQTGKRAHQRMQNIKNAFKVNAQRHYNHVVVFDDVVTTGASVAELSSVLKKAGVKKVDVWCLARAEKSSLSR